MLYLAFIFHMHQPYYKNLLTGEAYLPWVRLHGAKDYLDMARILEKYPLIHQTFNLVPSLLEQIEDYTNGAIKDKFLELSLKPAADLNKQEKEFILENFFMINKERVISYHPRYYELYFKKESKKEFSPQDYLDLQAWFNLSWIDPLLRQEIEELKNIVNKGRFFSEEDKLTVLNKQAEILKDIVPAYKKFVELGQIEVTVSPYYHPILPLLYNTKTALEADFKATLPKTKFVYPQDARAQIKEAIDFYRARFGGDRSLGMWPSEESVSNQILPFFIEAGINWIVADEAILFKSLKIKKRDTRILYQPHLIKRKEGSLNIVFRDRNLSDLISFVYHNYTAEAAVTDFMGHLKNISQSYEKEDVLVTIAMDGENAWEYYVNDGHDFLNLLYKRLSDSDFVRTTTVREYLSTHKPAREIKHLSAGSWIFANFSKWINNPVKNLAWEYLAKARQELEDLEHNTQYSILNTQLARKQIYICEGSDWFWWYGDNQMDFDYLFRTHLSNFYSIIGQAAPEYLKKPITT